MSRPSHLSAATLRYWHPRLLAALQAVPRTLPTGEWYCPVCQGTMRGGPAHEIGCAVGVVLGEYAAAERERAAKQERPTGREPRTA